MPLPFSLCSVTCTEENPPPTGLVGLTKLQYLNLSDNWLRESILAPIGQLVSLKS